MPADDLPTVASSESMAELPAISSREDADQQVANVTMPSVQSHDRAAASAPSPSKHSSRALYRELIFGLAPSVHVPNILQGTTTGLRSTLIPIFAKQLGASDATVGLITAMAGVARMVIGFPAGKLTSEMGFTAVMNIGMAINILGAIVAAIAWESITLGAANFFFGMGIGLFFTSRHVMLANVVERSKRGRLMSLIGGGERWSSVIGPALGGLLIEFGGSRWCSVGIVPVSLACAFCVTRSGRIRFLDEKYRTENRMRDVMEKESGQQASRRDMISLIRDYGYLIMQVGVYGINLIQMRTCRRLLLPLAAINAGFRPSAVGVILSLSFAVDATFFFLGGLVMDRFGRKYAAVPTSINMGLSFFVLGYADSSFELIMAAIMFGVADSLGAGLMLTLNADHAPKRAGAEFMGFQRMVQDSGQLLGPLIAGWVSEVAGFRTACVLFGILGLLNSVWAVFMLPEDACDEDNDNAGQNIAISAGPTTPLAQTATQVMKQ